MASDNDVSLAKREWLSGGDHDLLFDQIDARDHFGDRVFDLNPGVDLDEVEIVVRIDQELTGSGIHVARRLSPSRTAASESLVRTLAGRVGAGDSSTSF